MFGTANIYKHQEYGHQQSHASRNHFNWYEETNGGGNGQEESWHVDVHKETCWASLHDYCESTSGEGFICIPIQVFDTIQFFQG